MGFAVASELANCEVCPMFTIANTTRHLLGKANALSGPILVLGIIHASAHTATSMVVSDGWSKWCVPLHPNILSAAATASYAGRREDVEANGYAP